MSQKGASIIFILVGITGLLITFYYLNLPNKTQPNLSNHPETTIVSSIPKNENPKENNLLKLTADEEKNWLIYTDKLYKYSIRYPSNTESPQSRFHFIGDKNRKDTADGFGPNLSIFYRSDTSPQKAASWELKDKEQIPFEINNAKGVKVGDFDYYLQKNDNNGPVIRIIFNPQDYSDKVFKEKIQEMQNISEKMLLTFNFSDDTVK